MVVGVSTGFTKTLSLVGVGYKAAVNGQNLTLNLGYSHPIEMPVPKGLEVKVEKNTTVIVSGFDKEVVGQFAADVRSKREPEPYKGKGVRYVDEYVRRKEGKRGK
jgi:large subunit ribosomal protein L6